MEDNHKQFNDWIRSARGVTVILPVENKEANDFIRSLAGITPSGIVEADDPASDAGSEAPALEQPRVPGANAGAGVDEFQYDDPKPHGMNELLRQAWYGRNREGT